MKTYVFTLAQLGSVVTLNAVITDDEHGGNAVPVYGHAAFEVLSSALKAAAEGVNAGTLKVARGVVNGVSLEVRTAPAIVVPS